MKIKKKYFFWGGGGWGGDGVGGVRVDVNGELKFLRKFKKKKILKIFIYFFGGGDREGGVRWGGRVGGGLRMDVNAMLGAGGDVEYGGCEPRIEGIVQCTKRYCTRGD